MQLNHDLDRQFDLWGSDENITERFVKFDRKYPDIYWLFKRFSFEAMKAGLKNYGAKAIFERIRWHKRVELNGSDFKINNNYTSRYVRKLIFECPEFSEFFITRKLRS